MSTSSSRLSTADTRRPLVAAAALNKFAEGGFHATTVADVAREAGISPAYVFKLFPRKESLFVAALEMCFDEIRKAIGCGAADADGQNPAAILQAMGDAYAELIGDRRLLMMQVHAQSVADIAEIGGALREGMTQVTRLAKNRSGGNDDEVQRFIAYGQLCHLIVTLGIEGLTDPWSTVLNHGIRHPD